MNNPYFKRRKLGRTVNYEENYWGIVIDPDGKKRNRLDKKERIRHLKNVRDELNFLNSLPGGRVLDVGCGLGFFLSGLKNNWQKHGTELSSFSANHAKKYGTIFVGDLKKARYPSNYFDAIFMHHVIEHVRNPEAIITEIRRILKTSGVCIIGTPDFDSGCARRFGKNYRLLHDQTHISLFSSESMHRFLRDHGFAIDHVEYPYFNTEYFTKNNLFRLFNTKKNSPPFYGNFMTFYCHKPAAFQEAKNTPSPDTIAESMKIFMKRYLVRIQKKKH